mgnify:CR=1 FL=1
MTDYNSYKSWPFNEAKKIIKRFEKNNTKDKIIFETGYGPSGLPHIGTFGEVLRTNMVRFCYEKLTGKETDLIAFSDDMDGFRKVPDNIPNKEKLSNYLDYPLTSVPDPFELFNSFGEHNNSKLKDFLNRFNLPFSFQSSTDAYKSGLFNETIKKIIKNYDEIINVVLPTLGEERRKSYSPFFPISEITGKILQVPIEEINNEEFLCYKFRSMSQSDNSDTKQATKGDNRITKIGSFLRKSSLDEFPQFINVFMGDMSIVGPRPHMVEHDIKYSKLFMNYLKRHKCNPGLTGWAQVNGLRGSTSDEQMKKRMDYDLWYLNNWSIGLDLYIIFKTFYAVFKYKGE